MAFVQHGLWTLVAFFTLVAAQTVEPANTTTDVSTNSIILTPVQPSNIAPQISIVPLMAEADSALPPQGIQASIELTTPNNAANVSGKIAYISCDPTDYTGFKQASDVVSQVISPGTTTAAVLLYSTTSKFCNYTTSSNFSFVYSMTDPNDSSNLVERLRDNPQSHMFIARITHEGAVNSSDNGSSDNSGSQNNNPLGPSPTTTVAMIILYSITGVITALFLIVIVTGAVRAHRHPERYGPRSGTGRVRQSRARGIARAMLETLPIVKFGEREQSKPADVELGEHATTETGREESQENGGGQTSTEESSRAAPTLMTHQVSGLAPAENEATASGAASTNTSRDDREELTCSLCLNDFEVGEELRVLPCNHRFHPTCVDRWLLEVSGTCPLCRMDLHPQTSHTSETPNGENDDSPDALAPPLNEPEPSTETQQRPRSGLRDMLHFRHLRDASQEERISTLRRMREQPDSTESSSEENTRRRGLRTRLLDSFGVRTSTLASSERSQATRPAQTGEEQ